ncbi:geranylgeranyl transferase type-2 subunit alpha-like, partial [Mustelus asterias]
DRPETVSCLYASFSDQRVVVGFSKPVTPLRDPGTLLLSVDNRPVPCSWHTPDRRDRHSQVWMSELPAGTLNTKFEEQSVRVMWGENRVVKECFCMDRGRGEGWIRDSATDEELFRCDLSVQKSTVLQSELESCKQLQELEPGNKWCVLTIILLMRALDPLGYERETLRYFETLRATDPVRGAYFADLRSRYLIENAILKMEYAETRVVELAGK